LISPQKIKDMKLENFRIKNDLCINCGTKDCSCCFGCGKGGPGDRCCTCPYIPDPYYDDDNWRQREDDNEDALRRQD
jgi:hypothetical protein